MSELVTGVSSASSAKVNRIGGKRRLAWRRFRQGGLPVAGLGWLVFIAICAVVGQLRIAPPAFDMFTVHRGPSWQHPFGYDLQGEDLFHLVLRGLAPSLEITLFGTVLTVGIGMLVGVTAGLAGGWVDQVLMRFTELAYALPMLVLASLLVLDLGVSPFSVGLALGLVFWAGCARLVRGLVLTLRGGDLLDAARVSGASRWRVAWRYVIPHIAAALIVFFAFQTAAILFQQAVLMQLLPGYTGSMRSLTDLLFYGSQDVLAYQWLLWAPLGVFMSIVLSIMWVGDGLRAALNPKDARMRVSRRVRRPGRGDGR